MLDVHNIPILEARSAPRGSEQLLRRQADNVSGAGVLRLAYVDVSGAVRVQTECLRELIKHRQIILERVLRHHSTAYAKLDLVPRGRMAEYVHLAVARAGNIAYEDLTKLGLGATNVYGAVRANGSHRREEAVHANGDRRLREDALHESLLGATPRVHIPKSLPAHLPVGLYLAVEIMFRKKVLNFLTRLFAQIVDQILWQRV